MRAWVYNSNYVPEEVDGRRVLVHDPYSGGGWIVCFIDAVTYSAPRTFDTHADAIRYATSGTE